MGWFSRKPKPDPVGDICRLLVDEPLAWASTEVTNVDGARWCAHKHPSGIEIELPNIRRHGDVKLIYGGGAVNLIDTPHGDRVRDALLRRLGVIATMRRADVPETGRLLAKAVLDGQVEGIWLLVDYLLESQTRPAPKS